MTIINAMKLALAALETCRIRSVSEWSVEDITPKNVTAAIAALRTAIQQAEAQQPVTGEPVAKAWEEGYRRGVEDERTSNANIGIAGFGAKVDPARQNPYRDAAHPEPSVPDDVVLKAKRYEWLRKADRWPCVFPDYFDPEPLAGSDLAACVDAAMLAAKDASA